MRGEDDDSGRAERQPPRRRLPEGHPLAGVLEELRELPLGEALDALSSIEREVMRIRSAVEGRVGDEAHRDALGELWMASMSEMELRRRLLDCDIAPRHAATCAQRAASAYTPPARTELPTRRVEWLGWLDFFVSKDMHPDEAVGELFSMMGGEGDRDLITVDLVAEAMVAWARPQGAPRAGEQRRDPGESWPVARLLDALGCDLLSERQIRRIWAQKLDRENKTRKA